MRRYVRRDLLGNPRRTIASLVGVTLGVGLFSGVLFFMDASGATLTARAVAPLPLDMQRILTSPPDGGVRLTEHLGAPVETGGGEEIAITLTVTNDGAAPANEVVVNDVPPPPLSYASGTTTVDGEPMADVSGESPLAHGPAGFGLNLGRVGPGETVTISYVARAEQTVHDVPSLLPGGTVSSREQVEPVPANAPQVLTLPNLRRRVAAIPGVASADGLGFVDLPPGSLAVGAERVSHPVRVFAFDASYQEHHPSIRIVAGSFAPGSALLSAEAAGALSATAGDAVELRVPGRDTPLTLPVGGVLDLTDAQPLFASRRSTKLEEFLYVPDSVVVTPETFRHEIVPAFGRARASFGAVIMSLPVLELDVTVDRSALPADPGAALAQTTRIAQAVRRIAPGHDYLIDNISNTLRVARDDAAAGRRMFLFLGLPGILIACVLAAYAGSILAATERRERAILRVRGAHRGHLRRIAASKALVVALAGSLLGIALGAVAVVTVIRGTTLLAADPADLARSGSVALGAGAIVTSLALYLPARRSVGRGVNQERRELQVAAGPVWRRRGLDLVLLLSAAVAEVVAVRSGALEPPSGSVYSGLAISISSGLLVAPLLAWIGGVLVCERLFHTIVSHLPPPRPIGSGPAVSGIRSRSLRRRTGGLAVGVLSLGLVVAFGAMLAVFGATYDAAKIADARFVVGSDLRVVPSVLSAGPLTPADLTVTGVSTVSPVVFGLENSVLIGPHNQAATNLAAIDPATFAHVAPLSDRLFVDRSSTGAMADLAADPRGLLVDATTADDLGIGVGDEVEVILALGTDRETQVAFRVIGLLERLPGFPEGVDLVANRSRFRDATGLRAIDFFLADLADDSSAGVDRTIAALRSGPGAQDPLRIDTPATALDRDQSSLTALNVKGLSDLGSIFVVSMSAAVVAIFVFGLMLQRRREYVTLRALGLGMREVRALVLAEAGAVAVAGLTAGLLVGTAVAVMLIGVLRALFVLDPTVRTPVGRLSMLAAMVLAATVVSGLAATEVVRRLAPNEILREE